MTTTDPDWLKRTKDEDRELRAFVRFAPDLPAEKPAIRLGVKDIIDVAGLPTECGSQICEGQVPAATAPCVAMLEKGGVTVVGKTVTTEYATTKPGPTRNPLNHAHSPGGSSSGSAAGVGSGALDWALGTQTAGSVIRPAAFCGIVGFLPTAGRIPRGGVRIMSPTLDRVGLFARDVAGIEAMLKCFPAWAPDTLPDRPLRIAMLPAEVWEGADAATRSVIEGMAEAIRAAGDTVIDLPDAAPFLEMMAAQKVVMGYEILRSLSWELETHADLLSDELREFCEASRGITDLAYAEALETADRFRLMALRLFGEIDAIMGPASAQFPPEGLSWTGDPFVNRIWSLSKLPAIALPSAAAESGLKGSVQLNSGSGQDARLCAIAARYAPLAAAIRPG
ncbi:amidase family protein [Salipiger mucosus]|uniref:Glutamyl-tRNA(Gln) amidotransferase, A subunit n=1 Tax=Salipiger mucosus DSM 16094 TaxID=1123237 RepID=S9SG25_9RHOB|nr:amidase [Salipiger mucosus]EPX85239.1 glutamyl-tRNA(Gln) amidotransferase, A subunit [Salipiger mucosus DSM 16094]